MRKRFMIDGQKYFKKPISFWKSSNNFGLEHCVKSVLIRSFSGLYFPTFGLHTERYSVSLRIQSECGKIRTTKTPNIDNFHAVRFMIVSPQLVNSAKRKFLLLNIVIYLLNLVLLWSRARLAINKKQRTLYYFWFLLKENKEIRANLWLNL